MVPETIKSFLEQAPRVNPNFAYAEQEDTIRGAMEEL
jgi:hypothetical protein